MPRIFYNVTSRHCFLKIQSEIQISNDLQSKNILPAQIELFLFYCLRFYDRQFNTRLKATNGILEDFTIFKITHNTIITKPTLSQYNYNDMKEYNKTEI